MNLTPDIRPALDRERTIWAGRIWTKDAPFIGQSFIFKSPYGVYMNATQLLARACATRQILRFSIGPATKKQIVKERTAKGGIRDPFVRYEQAFDSLATSLNIDWSA